MTRLIQIALKEAYKVTDNRHRLGSVVISGGRIISKSHNFKWRHAEHRAISGIWESELKGATIIVVRPLYNKNKMFGLARPCQNCEKMLREIGFDKMIYSNNDGGFTVEKI